MVGASARNRGKAHGFPKRIRLCRRRDIDRVFREGRYRRLGLLHAKVLATGREESRFLVSVKKKVGKAHRRNRIKRLVREAIRLNRPRLPVGYDMALFVTRAPPQPLHLQPFDEEVRRLFSQLNRKPLHGKQPEWRSSSSG